MTKYSLAILLALATSVASAQSISGSSSSFASSSGNGSVKSFSSANSMYKNGVPSSTVSAGVFRTGNAAGAAFAATSNPANSVSVIKPVAPQPTAQLRSRTR